MLINIYSSAMDDLEEDEGLEVYTNNPQNLGHILGEMFRYYGMTWDDKGNAHCPNEFTIEIEVLDEALEAARQRPLC